MNNTLTNRYLIVAKFRCSAKFGQKFGVFFLPRIRIKYFWVTEATGPSRQVKKNSAQKTKEKKNKTEKFDLAIMTWVERGRERGREIETVKERVSD